MLLVLSKASKTRLVNDSPEARTYRVVHANISRANRDGAHGGATGRDRSGLDADRTVRPGNKLSSYPPRHREHIA